MTFGEFVMLVNGMCLGAVGATFLCDWLDRRHEHSEETDDA